jgi:DNA-binding NtrC family response regulator
LPRILIVDDVPELCELLRETFTDEGFTAATAANAAEARRILATGTFDLVLVDAVMPGEQGGSLADFVGSLGIKVVLMTGDPSMLEADPPRWPCLPKPFRIGQAIDLVHQVLAAGRIDVHRVNTL